ELPVGVHGAEHLGVGGVRRQGRVVRPDYVDVEANAVAGDAGVRRADVGLDRMPAVDPGPVAGTGVVAVRVGIVGRLVEVVLLDEGQDEVMDVAPGWAIVRHTRNRRAGPLNTLPPQQGRIPLVRVVEVVDGQAHLFEVVLALGASGGLADFLDGGQQQ